MGAGVATQQLHAKGIYYSGDLFGTLMALWDQNWMSRNRDFTFPRQDDPEVVCPWESREELALREEELKKVVSE